MKILVSLPNDFSESKFKTFLDGSDHLKKQGHNIVIDNPSSRKNDKASKSKVDKMIRDTDIVLAEVSQADLRVGFNIARALDEKKIVIALEKDTVKDSLLANIDRTVYKNLLIKKYNPKSVVSIVADAIEEAKKMMDTKFILIISPEIDRYLDWASQTKRMHKAQIVRNSVEAMLKKDREYKNYLGE